MSDDGGGSEVGGDVRVKKRGHVISQLQHRVVGAAERSRMALGEHIVEVFV